MKESVILREGILLEGREHSWWEEMEEEFAAIHAANSWDLLYRVGQESQHRLPNESYLCSKYPTKVAITTLQRSKRLKLKTNSWTGKITEVNSCWLTASNVDLLNRYRDVYPYDHSRVPLVEVSTLILNTWSIPFGDLCSQVDRQIKHACLGLSDKFIHKPFSPGGQHGLYQRLASHM